MFLKRFLVILTFLFLQNVYAVEVSQNINLVQKDSTTEAPHQELELVVQRVPHICHHCEGRQNDFEIILREFDRIPNHELLFSRIQRLFGSAMRNPCPCVYQPFFIMSARYQLATLWPSISPNVISTMRSDGMLFYDQDRHNNE